MSMTARLTGGATAARARPTASAAQLPLPGGREGASVVLHPLLCATMSGPVGWFHRTAGPTSALRALGLVGGGETVEIPIVAFLVEHPGAGAFLIDTGFHTCVAARSSRDRARNLGPVGRIMGRTIAMRPEQSVAGQLRERGIDPAEIGLIVMTHLHFDHASGLGEFPGASVLVAAPEWEAACGRGGALGGYSLPQLDPGLDYRTYDPTGAPARARGAFAHTLDVFGDGSVTLAATPGHSAGHTSVIVRLAEREALIAGDAIYTIATLREGERPWRCEDRGAFERSVAMIAAYDGEHPDALIVPGHDLAHWRGLATRYA